MPRKPMARNRLREALVAAVDDRAEAIATAAEQGRAVMRRVTAEVVVAAARAGATEADVQAAAQTPEAMRLAKVALLLQAMAADEHAMTHAEAIRKAGPGPDHGPITRAELEARRKAKLGG